MSWIDTSPRTGSSFESTGETWLARATAKVSHGIYVESGEVTLHGAGRGRHPGPLLLVVREPVLLGAAELISGRRWPFSIVTRGSCRWAKLTRTQMLERVASPSSPALFSEIAILSERLLFALQQSVTRDVASRLVELLWTLGVPSDDPDEVFVSELSQAQLARLLGVSIRTVARHLRGLEDRGILRRERRRIHLLEDRRSRDRGQLHRRCSALWEFRSGMKPRCTDGRSLGS